MDSGPLGRFGVSFRIAALGSRVRLRGPGMICPFCGASAGDRADRFCRACGKNQGKPAPEPDDRPPKPSKAATRLYRRCPGCTEVADDDALFCAHCGHDLGASQFLGRKTRPARLGKQPGRSGDDAPMVLRGDVIWERYQVECTLRREADRRLYRARDLRSSGGSRVVVEVLDRARVDDEAWVRRLEQRVAALAGFTHVNAQDLVRFHRGKRFTGVVKEWIGGASLAHHLDGSVQHPTQRGPRDPYPLPRVSRLVSEIGAALDELHGAGHVHGALHPGNVVLRPVPQPDSGPRSYTAAVVGIDDGPDGPRTGPIVRTPDRYASYLAPEVARAGASPSPQADRFALGGLAYRLLTGEDASWPPRPPTEAVPSLPPAAAAEVMAYLKHDPGARPGRASLLGQTLRRIAESPGRGRALGPPQTPAKGPAAQPFIPRNQSPGKGPAPAKAPATSQPLAPPGPAAPPTPRWVGPSEPAAPDPPWKIAMLNLLAPGLGYHRIDESRRAARVWPWLALWCVGLGIFVHIFAALDGYALATRKRSDAGPGPKRNP